MPAYYAPRFEQFLQQAIGTFATRAGLTDVADSSVTKYLFAGLSRILDELSYATVQQQLVWNLDTASGADLDSRASELTAGTLTRLAAGPASGSVVFSTNSPGGSVTIPVGTQVATADGLTFTTTAPGSISPTSAIQVAGHIAGQDSDVIPIVARAAGAAGNVPTGSLTSLPQRPAGVDTAINLAPTQFGRNQESDDALRARVRGYAASLARSTPAAIEGAVLGTVDPSTGASITHANLVESETQPGYATLYIDDGSGEAASTASVVNENLTSGLLGQNGQSAAGGETTLQFDNVPLSPFSPPQLISDQRGELGQGSDYSVDVLAGKVTLTQPLSTNERIIANYVYSTGLVQLAQKIVDGDPNNRQQYPGYRAAGTRVTVTVPQIISVPVKFLLSVDPSYDVQAVQQAAAGNVIGMVNAQGISESVRRSALIAAIMGTPGVTNTTMLVPAQDVVVTNAQLARTDASRVEVS